MIMFSYKMNREYAVQHLVCMEKYFIYRNMFTFSMLFLFIMMRKLTNCILPLETKPVPASHYMSCYTSVAVEEHRELLCNVVQETNLLLKHRLNQLRLGKFDSVNINWETLPLQVVHLSDLQKAGIDYHKHAQEPDALIPMLKEQMPVFNATFLNKDTDYWPQKFIPTSETYSPNDYHISFLPLIRYPDNDLSIIPVLNGFMSTLKDVKPFKVRTTGSLQLFPKWDMQKVFLGLEVESTPELKEMFEKLQQFRLDLPNAGIAVGETEGFMFNWADCTPHISIGVWKSPKPHSSHHSQFAFWEFIYLCEVLMNSGADLEERFAARAMGGTLPEVPVFEFNVDNAVLVANGQKFKKTLA